LTSCEIDNPDARIFSLSAAASLSSISLWSTAGNRVLPDKLLSRNLRAEIAGARTHVAVRELVPGARERVRELIRMLEEAPRDFLVGRIEAQGEIGGQHRRRMTLRGVVRIRHRTGAGVALRLPLMCAGRALGELPFEAEQVLEEVVAPLGRRRGPDDFQAATDGVAAAAGAEGVLPAEALFLDIGAFGQRADILVRIGSAVGLAEAVAAGDQRHRLLVVHRHAAERLANVLRRLDGIGIAVRAFRIDVDQAHLDGAERILELTVAAVALVGEPLALTAPIDVLRRLPHVGTSAGETEGLEAHRFQRDVAGEDHQVRPRDLIAVLLLDRPQQPARLVEVHVVRPAVEWRETLRAGASATAAIADAIGPRTVPRHADEQRPVMAEIRRPPGLRVGHQREQVLLEGLVVELLELVGVVEILAHRVGLG
jgi:hypothetical protein